MADVIRTRIRPAQVTETQTLTALCRRSKAHWGYDADFLARSAYALTVTPAMIEAGRVLAADEGGAGLLIPSDPFADAFYRRMGAVRIGDAPSDAIPGRRLPLLEFAVVVGGDRQAS